MPGQDKNACIAAITGSLITDVSTTVMNAANLTAWDLVDRTGEAVWNGFETGANQKNCLNFITPQKIMLALGQQSAVALKAVQAINIARKSIEITGYLYPFVDPIEINEIIQLYDGKLKELCVEVVKDGNLNEEYGPGQIIYPGIKLSPQSPPYAEWIKSGFKVKWVVEAGNGSVNLPESNTDSEGKGTVAWTLPENRSGEVKLKAEILDKEGDHLTGSPIEFKTIVVDICETNYNPPIIKSLNRTCGQNMSYVYYLIEFEAEKGFIPAASYFGHISTYPKAYPVRLEWFNESSGEYEVASNGYTANLLEGDKFKGLIEMAFNTNSRYTRCERNEDYPDEHRYPNFRLSLVDACGKRSNIINFDIITYVMVL
jgi:hypothetical protein